MSHMNTPDPADSEQIPRELRRALTNDAVWVDPPAELHNNALAALQAARAASAPASIMPNESKPAVGTLASNSRYVGWSVSAAAVLAVVGGLIWTLLVDVPDSSLALTGTDLASAASAQVEITEKASGFEVVLDIDDLASAEDGSYYQAWFKDADGVLVTIGTFHARESGQDIVLWSGVDPAEYDVLTVTLQRVGGGAKSSGEVLLSGRLNP
jgi:Anti-sigma-K factor rskA